MPPQLAEQRLRHRADTRRVILDAAETLLVEGGAEGLSMRRLAERCGCTAPTLYHYFRDKPTLVAALLEERLQRLIVELRAVELGADGAENFRALCRAFAAFAVRNPSHYQLLMMNRDDDAPDPPAAQELRALLVEPLAALVPPGDAREVDTVRQSLWSLLHGFILLQTTRPEEDWAPDLLDRSIDALLRGWTEVPA